MVKKYMGIVNTLAKNSGVKNVGLNKSSSTAIPTISRPLAEKKFDVEHTSAHFLEKFYSGGADKSFAYYGACHDYRRFNKGKNESYELDKEGLLNSADDITKYVSEALSPVNLKSDPDESLIEVGYAAIIREDMEIFASPLFQEILKSKKYREQLLNFAVALKAEDFIKTLFEQVTIGPDEIIKALIIASSNDIIHGFKPIIRLLLEEFKDQGNDLKTLNISGLDNILLTTMMCNNNDLFVFLLEQGCDPNGFISSDNNNLLQVALDYPDNPSIEKCAYALVEYGIDINHLNNHQESAFDMATAFKKKEMINAITAAVEKNVGGFSDNTQEHLLPHEPEGSLFSRKNLAPVIGCKAEDIKEISQNKRGVIIYFNLANEAVAKNAKSVLISEGISNLRIRSSSKFFDNNQHYICIEIPGNSLRRLARLVKTNDPLSDMDPKSFTPL